jgi:outer membrane protein assembly factor BamB
MYALFDNNATTAKLPGDLRHTLVALDTRNGQVVWRHPLEPANMHNSPTFKPFLQDGSLYVGYFYDDPQGSGLHHGVFEALDPATGKLRWRHEAGAGPAGAPVIAGSLLYLSSTVATEQNQVVTETGLVEAIDSKTGATRWSTSLDGTPGAPALADERIVVTTKHIAPGGAAEDFRRHLVALNAVDGAVHFGLYLSVASGAR